MKANASIVTVLGLALMGVGTSVQAVSVNGDIQLIGAGVFTYAKVGTSSGTFLEAEETSYASSVKSAMVDPSSPPDYDYSSLSGAASINVSEFTFKNVLENVSGVVTGPASFPVNGTLLWDITTGSGKSLINYAFYITDLDLTDSFIIGGKEGLLYMEGDGYATISGPGTGSTVYTDTLGTWTISDQATSNSKIPLTITTSVDPDPVPDGGLTVSLLGLGLVGCSLVGRKFIKAD